MIDASLARPGPPPEVGHPAEPPAPAGHPARQLALVATLAVGLVLVLQVFLSPPGSWRDQARFAGAHRPQNRAELLITKMDGNSFAVLAMDPTLARSLRVYGGDSGHAAYRSARPVQGWIDYVASLGGQRWLLAPAMLVLSAIEIGLAILAIDGLGRALGRRVSPLWAILATPAFVASVAYPGLCDPLAIALVAAATTAWLRERAWLAVALFTAAALTRETMLIVPLSLGVAHVWRTRNPIGVLKLAVPAGAYGAWLAFVHARTGGWPTDYGQSAGAFQALRDVQPYWHAAEYLSAALLLASFAVIAWRGTDWMRVVAAINVLLLVFMGDQIALGWFSFGRVTALVPILALVALGRPIEATEPDVAPVPDVAEPLPLVRGLSSPAVA